jgi:putative resolvase
MKLSEYAKKLGISYRTAWRYYIVREELRDVQKRAAIYCRVSSAENKSNLELQKNRLLVYCAAKGYYVSRVVTETGSGINDSRNKWLSLLQDKQINLIVVEHKDRFTRFGFNAYKILLHNEDRDVEVINEADNEKEDLLQDLVSIITSFCARLYGQRRCKRKTEKIIGELTGDKKVNDKS